MAMIVASAHVMIDANPCVIFVAKDDIIVHASHFRAGLQRNAEFAGWLAQLVVGGLYPGSPFSRRLMALETMRLMLQVGSSGAGSAR